MERRQLEFFLAIADAGSFTRAARVLSIAQPSLSYAIRSLEDELGERLFERHGRGVRLTPAGDALVTPARRTVRSFAQAAGAVRGANDDGFAQLRIVANTLWAVDPLVRIVGDFRQLRPRVQLEITDPASRTVVLEQVRLGEVDFGLVDGPPPGGSVASLRLVDHDVVAILPPTLQRDLGAAPDTTLDDLVPLGLICTPRGTDLRALLDDRLDAAGLPRTVTLETAHVASVVPLVLAGAGVALLPEGMAADASALGARVARLSPPAHASVSLLWRPDRLTAVGADLLGVAAYLAERTV